MAGKSGEIDLEVGGRQNGLADPESWCYNANRGARESVVGGPVVCAYIGCKASMVLDIDREPRMQQLEPEVAEEEILVAELGLLGIHYLSRNTAFQPDRVRPPETLLADLVRQPSARVRAAVIAVLLSHPAYAEAVPAALERLSSGERLTLQSFYAAAVLLQQEYADRLRPFMARRWQWLPDPSRIAPGWSAPTGGTPREKLTALGLEHRRRAQEVVNWTGTYEQVVHQLLRQWALESRWNQ